MKWLWPSLYAVFWIPFLYQTAQPWWGLWIATQDPSRICWLTEAYEAGHFLTPVEAAFFIILFYGLALTGLAALVVLIWHRNTWLILKLAAILLPAGASLAFLAFSSSAYNEAYFDIYRIHCPNAVQQ